jgi:hypothetical protein
LTLRVVIPTVVRETLPKTVRAARTALEDVPGAGIDVWVNPISRLNSRGRDLLVAAERQGAVIHVHDTAHPTAEASAFHAIAQVKADWAWILGDDDHPLPGSGHHIHEMTTRLEASLWLLNLSLVWHEGHPPGRYYVTTPSPLTLPVEDAFSLLGYCSAATTLSALVVRPTTIDLEVFDRLHDLSGIYSHTFALRLMLANRRIGISDRQCVMRRERPPEAIGLSVASGLPPAVHPLFPWTAGLWRLSRVVASELGTTVGHLLSAFEAELILQDEEPPKVLRTTTRSLVRRFWIQLLQSTESKGQIQALSELAEDHEFFEVMRIAEHDQQLELPSPILLNLSSKSAIRSSSTSG